MKKYFANCNDSEQQRQYFYLKTLFYENKFKQFLKVSSKYLENYPDDYKVIFKLAKVYKYFEKYDLSIINFKLCLKCNDVKIYNYSLIELFYIYYSNNMYQEVMKLLPILCEKKLISSKSLSICELVINNDSKYVNYYKDGKRNYYIKRQILDYSENMALNYINRHTKYGDNNCVLSIFNDIDIIYLFEVIKNNLKKSKRANINDVLDIYFFGINNIGYIKDSEDVCNYIKVVVVPNTTNIISIYPTTNPSIKDVKLLEYDYDKLFIKGKVKRMSQIDKFNNRYKRV